MKRFTKRVMDKITNPEKNFEKEVERKIKRLKRSDAGDIDDLEETLDTLEEKYNDMLYDPNITILNLVSVSEEILVATERLNTILDLYSKRYE